VDPPYVLPPGGRLKGAEGKARNFIGARQESPMQTLSTPRVTVAQFRYKPLNFLKFIG